MTSGKLPPPVFVKPTIGLLKPELKSSATVNAPMPSVLAIAKRLEDKLIFPDRPKNKIKVSQSDGKLMQTGQGEDDTANSQKGIGVHRRSSDKEVQNGRREKNAVNSDKGGITVIRRSSDHDGTRRVTRQNPTSDSSGSTERRVNWMNAGQTIELRDKESQVQRTNDDLDESCDELEVWLYSPVSLLMKQIKDSVEMPCVNVTALPEAELVQLLSLYNEDVDRTRIRFICEWNDIVNQLLESTGYSSSDFYRNIASLILCRVNLDIDLAQRCLGNDRVKLIITRHKSKLVQRGLTANPANSGHQDNENSGMNDNTWSEVVDEVMAYEWQSEIECPVEQECQICWDTFPSDKIFGLSFCKCIVCNPCMRKYFEIMIHDGYVANFICPVCHLPDVEDADNAPQHFQLLEPKLKTLLSAEDFGAYQRKMTEWHLVRNPNFLWCINATCHSGFLIGENTYSPVTCRECKSKMCHKCKKPWEEQHVGLTCELFRDWKESNDPKSQEEALRRQLQENGIDCPRCGRPYLLSKGGCIHFTCIVCQYEFCSSCSRPFVRSCRKSSHCRQSGGLHCHHPRNCLYYLRDRSVNELQRLLKSNHVSYEASSQTHITTCPVLEEKDADTGFKLELCHAESFLPGHAGSCEKHYKEYLAGIIQRNQIDPAEVMSQSELIRELQNSGNTVPKQLTTETESQYWGRLTQLVMASVLLPRQDH